MTLTDAIATSRKSALELVTFVQDQIVDANRDIAHRVNETVTTLPFADSVAWDTSLAEQSLAFTQELVDANRAFAVKLLAAWAPSGSAANGVKAATSKK